MQKLSIWFITDQREVCSSIPNRLKLPESRRSLDTWMLGQQVIKLYTLGFLICDTQILEEVQLRNHYQSVDNSHFWLANNKRYKFKMWFTFNISVYCYS